VQQAHHHAANGTVPYAEFVVAAVPEKEYRRSMLHLLIQNGNGEFLKHELRGENTTIGRHPDNQIVLTSDSVSGRHAEIEQTSTGFSVRDLGSSNGTKLNGQLIQEAALKNGDTITFGGIETTFVQQVPAPTPLPEIQPESAVKNEVKDQKSNKSSLQSAAKLTVLFLLRAGDFIWMRTKGAVELAALKAKIEKLKRIDLAAAHYTLGKKCHELGLHRDQFAEQLEAIAALEGQIVEKSKAVPVAENETTGGKMKRVGADVWASTEAATLGLKLKLLTTELGKTVMDASSDDSALAEEIAAVTSVMEAIHADEFAASKLGSELKIGVAMPARIKVIRASLVIAGAVILLVGLPLWFHLRRERQAQSLEPVVHRLEAFAQSATYERTTQGNYSLWRRGGLVVQYDGTPASTRRITIGFVTADIDLSKSTLKDAIHDSWVWDKLAEWALMVGAANKEATNWVTTVCLPQCKDVHETTFDGYRYTFVLIVTGKNVATFTVSIEPSVPAHVENGAGRDGNEWKIPSPTATQTKPSGISATGAQRTSDEMRNRGKSESVKNIIEEYGFTYDDFVNAWNMGKRDGLIGPEASLSNPEQVRNVARVLAATRDLQK